MELVEPSQNARFPIVVVLGHMPRDLPCALPQPSSGQIERTSQLSHLYREVGMLRVGVTRWHLFIRSVALRHAAAFHEQRGGEATSFSRAQRLQFPSGRPSTQGCIHVKVGTRLVQLIGTLMVKVLSQMLFDRGRAGHALRDSKADTTRRFLIQQCEAKSCT
eukprot:3710100-Amphidinium_carterae.1